MSHPGAISWRCRRTISRTRLRMRFRRTAPPCAFFTLMPKRLMVRPFGRMKMRNGWFDLRRPSRYAAWKSERRRMRQPRGKSSGERSDRRERVASFFPTSGKNLPSTFSFHARAETMFLGAAPHTGLIGTFRQFLSPSRFGRLGMSTDRDSPRALAGRANQPAGIMANIRTSVRRSGHEQNV